MATLPTYPGAVTITDLAKTLDPDGKIATIIEMLKQRNEMLDDMTWMEGNLTTGHRTTIRAGLPTPTWRKLYGGVQPSKSAKVQIDDTCGMLESRTEIDVDLAKMSQNVNAFRLSESGAEAEGMNQTVAQALFYGDTSVNPERFTGLSPRYATVSAAVPSSANVIDGGGTGTDNMSVWLIVWGDQTLTGIYPKGTTAGLDHQDLGEIDAFDNSQTPPGRYRAYADRWTWKCGLSVRDWRYAVRIANIDVSDLQGQTGTQAPTAATQLMKLMARATTKVPQMGMGRAAFYMNRTAKGYLAVSALDKSNTALAIQPALQQFGDMSPGWTGNGTMTFLGIPCRTSDQLLLTEARVV